MTRSDFIGALEDQLEVPGGSLNDKQELADLKSWDSLAAVLFIALADEKLGVTISANEIARSKTIDDLLSLVETRLTA